MVPMLVSEGYSVIGYDIGYYENCNLTPSPQTLIKQTTKDIRDVCVDDLKGVDSVIHLCALSNDPLGEFNETLTEDINFKATVKLAECAKQAGVRRFLYASSQSVYGISDANKEVDEDGAKNPLTAYAVTKWKSEQELGKLSSDNFAITILRPATAYGMSPNLRTDIVFNAFVAYAFINKMIEIKSDGTPWRPMAHVKDISAAFIACLKAPVELINNQAFNVGTADNNYTVRELATVAQRCVPDAGLTFTNEHTDPRSYRVTSNKILTILKDYYNPEWNIERGGEELMKFYEAVGMNEDTFNGYKCTRLKCLKKNIEDGLIDNNLYKIK
jgi:nucleoside-diphosphate-sugar epimerase